MAVGRFFQLAVRVAAFVGTLILPVNSAALELNELRYITEHSPPYNYVEHGELKGPAVDLLVEATARAGSPVERQNILVQPWARALRNTLEGPNTVLFNTIRTPERESLFKWAGPTGSEKYVLIAAKRRNLTIDSAEMLATYRIGAVRDDAGEVYLRDLGLGSNNLTLASNVDSLGKMLQANRIDLWAFGEDGWRQTLENIAIDPGLYEAVYLLKQNDYYFAFSLDVDDQLVEKMQAALDSILLDRANTVGD